MASMWPVLEGRGGGRKRKRKKTYVIERTASLANLNHLDASFRSVRHHKIRGQFDRGQTKRSVASLVEVGHKGDVEGGGVVAA